MSMKTEIMKRYLRLPTAHELWNALLKAFYDGSDELQVFSSNQKAFTSKQNEKSLSAYYEELVEIFWELDHRDKVVMKDPDDVIAYQKSIERLRVHIFLDGLDSDFEQVRGEILCKEPVPDLEDCYSLIRWEAVRRVTLNTEIENTEVAVMMTRNHPKTTKGTKNLNTSVRITIRLDIQRNVAMNLWDTQNDGIIVEHLGERTPRNQLLLLLKLMMILLKQVRCWLQLLTLMVRP